TPSAARNERSLASFVTSVGILVGTLAVLLAAVSLNRVARNYLRGDADRRIADAAERSAWITSLYLRDHREELVLIAGSPAVKAAARAGAQTAVSRGLPLRSIAEQEREFSATRTLDSDPMVT